MTADTPGGAGDRLPCRSRQAPPVSLWCRALPSGLYCLQWLFDSHASSPGLACIPDDYRLDCALHEGSRATNPWVNPVLDDGLLGRWWYLWSEHVCACLCVCVSVCVRRRALQSTVCCFQVQVKGTWRLSSEDKGIPSLAAGL